MQFCCCNLSPRGDGNSIRPRDVHGYAMLQFIPARGRKHFLQRFNKCAAVSGLQFIPARGRKPTHQHHWFCRHPPVAIYPREGTETCSHQRARSIPDCCNLSPRGDGNIRGIVDVYSVLGCNLSPRGDGNISMLVDFMLEMVAIYPREGTETKPEPDTMP